jgi:hypothetical protein
MYLGMFQIIKHPLIKKLYNFLTEKLPRYMVGFDLTTTSMSAGADDTT